MSGSRTLFAAAFLLCVGVAFEASAFAQSSSLEGRVLDPRGAMLVGAQITATLDPSGRTWTTRTDARGHFELTTLPAGSYRLTASASGFEPATRSIVLAEGSQATMDFQLSLASVKEVITVTESTEGVRAEMERVPGGTELIGRSEISATRAYNLKDVFAMTPGVVAQSRWGSDESQLSIRGSGLRNNFHLRGINLLVNGIPYQDADGFSDFESIELTSLERVEVWKGANALRYGGNSMGGAVNFVTPTGATTRPFQIRLEGGSFGAFKAQIATGGVRGPFSYYVSLSDAELDGYRDHSQQGRQRLFSNLGFKLADSTDLRFDIVYANVAERLPGSLTRSEFLAGPRQADANNITQNWGRFYDYVRLGTALTHRFGDAHHLSFKLFGHYRSMDHPIFQVLDQDARNFGGELHYRFTGALAGRKHSFVIGFAPQIGGNGERRYVNDNGQRGNLVSLFHTEARNYGLYFEDQIDITQELTVSFGGRADWASRRFDDRFLTDGDRSDDRRFSAFSPKVGLVWRAAESVQIFGNVSRSYEPPLLLELTSFGAPGFLPLEAQDTWQYEVGTRGSLNDRLKWDLTFFDAEIDNEIINLNVQPFPGAPFTIPSYRNALQTRHLGLEIGTGASLKRDLLGTGDALSWRSAFTWSRFQFVNDPTFGDNRLAGAPPHVLRTELRYDHPRGFWIAPNLDWSPSDYFVDSANTALNDQYAVFNLKAGLVWKKTTFFIEGSNLADRNYSGSVQVDSDSGRFYEPANGRSVYVGLRLNF